MTTGRINQVAPHTLYPTLHGLSSFFSTSLDSPYTGQVPVPLSLSIPQGDPTCNHLWPQSPMSPKGMRPSYTTPSWVKDYPLLGTYPQPLSELSTHTHGGVKSTSSASPTDGTSIPRKHQAVVQTHRVVWYPEILRLWLWHVGITTHSSQGKTWSGYMAQNSFLWLVWMDNSGFHLTYAPHPYPARKVLSNNFAWVRPAKTSDRRSPLDYMPPTLTWTCSKWL